MSDKKTKTTKTTGTSPLTDAAQSIVCSILSNSELVDASRTLRTCKELNLQRRQVLRFQRVVKFPPRLFLSENGEANFNKWLSTLGHGIKLHGELWPELDREDLVTR